MSGPDPRRERGAAVLAAAAAGGLALFAGSQTWATLSAVRPEPLPPVTGALTGSAAAPLVPAAGLVLLAAAGALLAVRGGGRAAVGALMMLAGAALSWSGVRTLADGPRAAAAEVPVVAGTPAVEVAALWPSVVVGAGLLGILGGLIVLLRGRRWPGLARRYERSAPAGRRHPSPDRAQADEDRALLAWQALDRGEDPTDRGPAGPPDRPF